MVLLEVNQEVENDGLKINPPPSSSSSSDNKGEARVDYCDDDENLSDTDSEDEWDKPSKV